MMKKTENFFRIFPVKNSARENLNRRIKIPIPSGNVNKIKDRAMLS